ncbi:kinase A anchor protein [Chaetomidium leptoderma]|uniref:Kinase A anchor protein n=1 Tax=Chaetomidium leptoderma TaxID=669021 RepID=A0AAN6VRM7_9PEZI|nr:kinase A anchor protein [Chaetomidium leptoderma]
MPPKPSPTHFLCIPLVTGPSRPQLAASLSAFRSDVCGGPAASPLPPLGLGFGSLPEDAVRPVGTLHLTLGVLSLPPRGSHEGGEEKKLARAKEVLAGLGLGAVWRGVLLQWQQQQRAKGVVQKTNGGGNGDGDGDRDGKGGVTKEGVGKEKEEKRRVEGLKITLRGLASMQPADRAAVLYAPPVDQFGLLQAFCEKVRDAFREAELMVDEGRPLLLHATIVNTVYVKKEAGSGRGRGRGRGGQRGGRGGRKSERLVFDATEIMDRYEDQVWMEDVLVQKVALCRMGAKKVVVDGEEDEAYEVEAEVEF